jgi:hypothetical protein
VVSVTRISPLVNDKSILPLNMYRTYSSLNGLWPLICTFFQSHGEKCGNSFGFQGKPYHFSLHIKFLLNVFNKGIVSRDEHFLKVFKNELVLSVHAPIIFKIFCILADETIKLKV